MKTLQDITGAFIVAKKESDDRYNATRREGDRLQEAALRYQRLAAQKMGEYYKLWKKHNSERGTCWTTDLLRPLLEEIEERTGWMFANKNDLRTFGLRCECPVHIDGEEEDEVGMKWKAYLTFTPSFRSEEGDYTLYIDTGRTKGASYPADSIGAINGFNNERVQVESVEQIIELLQKQMEA